MEATRLSCFMLGTPTKIGTLSPVFGVRHQSAFGYCPHSVTVYSRGDIKDVISIAQQFINPSMRPRMALDPPQTAEKHQGGRNVANPEPKGSRIGNSRM